MRAALRIGWTIATVVVVESAICAIAVLPVAVGWSWILSRAGGRPAWAAIALSLAVLPSYVLFALTLMLVSAAAVRLLRWHTPATVESRIADVEWPVLRWVRSMVVTHVVRVAAGSFFRGSPIWTAYLRLAGARLGRRVYVNSLAVTDYNLLDFADGVVIGDGVHLSGHTVEHGLLKTAPIRLGRDVTVGVGSVIDIGIVAEDGCQIGAMSFVPKYARLRADGVYYGIPVQLMSSSIADQAADPV